MEADEAATQGGLFSGLEKWSRPARKWLWTHRGKVAVAAAVVATAAAVYYTTKAQQPLQLEDMDEDVDGEDDDWNDVEGAGGVRGRRRVRNAASLGSAAKPAQKSLERSRMLLRVRKQYDVAAMYFLPTLKLKIAEYVDVANTIKQIRDLRAGNNSAIGPGEESPEKAEERLWEEIKVTSFTHLFVTAYMEIAISLVLRIQIHILARSAKSLEPSSSSASSSSSSSSLSSASAPASSSARPFPLSSSSSSSSSSAEHGEGEADPSLLDSDMFKVLIPGTYKQVFGAGLKLLTATVRRRVEADLSSWNAKRPIEYSELAQKLTSLRQSFERDLHALVSMIVLPPEAFAPEQTGLSSSASASGSTGAAAAAAASASAAAGAASILGAAGGARPSVAGSTASHTPADAAAQSLLSQVWDVVDSYKFAAVFSEAADTCFRHIFESLRRNVFAPENLTGNQRRVPSVASLLPQIKTIADRMLPKISDPMPSEAKEIVSGAALDALCIALFDSPSPPSANGRSLSGAGGVGVRPSGSSARAKDNWSGF